MATKYPAKVHGAPQWYKVTTKAGIRYVVPVEGKVGTKKSQNFVWAHSKPTKLLKHLKDVRDGKLKSRARLDIWYKKVDFQEVKNRVEKTGTGAVTKIKYLGEGYKYPPSARVLPKKKPSRRPAAKKEPAKEGCFIATASMKNTRFEQDIMFLRDFRDDALPEPMVQLYYGHSPKIAHRISKSEILKGITRVFLWPFVQLMKFKYK